MKKMAVAAALAATTTISAFAGNQNMAGCGLGNMIFKDQNTMVFQLLAATTNGISGNQTFGITSGTLGCTPDGAVAANEELNMFTGKNLDKLAADMAKGEGETLSTFAALRGIEDKAAFFAASQAQFGAIFTHDNITAGEVIENVEKVIADAKIG